MGMDLFSLAPTSDEVGGRHYNWTGWGMIGELLEELGCDVSELSGSNDGDVVSAEAARAWGTAINEALDTGRIYSVFYGDRSIAGGRREELRVEDTVTPVILSVHEIVSAMFEDKAFTDEERDSGELDRAPEKVLVVAGSETFEWLCDVATYFLGSGGFEQC